jgi:hypothetical protein
MHPKHRGFSAQPHGTNASLVCGFKELGFELGDFWVGVVFG